MPLCPGVQSMSFSLPVLMFYVLQIPASFAFSVLGLLFNPIGQTRLTEERNRTGVAEDGTLGPFLPCNPRFTGVHISQGNAGLKK